MTISVVNSSVNAHAAANEANGKATRPGRDLHAEKLLKLEDQRPEILLKPEGRRPEVLLKPEDRPSDALPKPQLLGPTGEVVHDEPLGQGVSVKA